MVGLHRFLQRALIALGLVVTFLVLASPEAERRLVSERERQFLGEFSQSIYPLLKRGGKGSCLACHDDATSSDLEFVGNPRDDFYMLLSGGYFQGDQPDSLLGRIAATNRKRRMPKGKDAIPWSSAEQSLIRAFSESVAAAELGIGGDEGFPIELLSPYEGPELRDKDTQFLTMTQLRGKVKTLFEDAWIRDGVDLFDENVALFGGADFETRFNETSRASSGYLSALRRLARDLAERSYVTGSGPFRNRAFAAGSKADVNELVNSLYRSILFRDAQREELDQALMLFETIEAQSSHLRERPGMMTFEIVARDPTTGRCSADTIEVPLRAGNGFVYQQWMDESEVEVEQGKAALPLAKVIPLSSEGTDQAFVLDASHSRRPVSFVGLLLEHSDAKTVEWIGVGDSRVRLEGAWKKASRKGVSYAESQSGGTGEDRIIVPLSPDYDGDYRLTVYSRTVESLSAAGLIEVRHSGTESDLAVKSVGPELVDGLVRFSFDATVDTRSSVKFESRFQFADGDYVEINNRGTHAKVAVGPLGFLGEKGVAFEIDTKEAEGFDEWAPFKAISFNAYNQKGTRVEDKNERKGELFLRYRPELKRAMGWQESEFYRLQVYYPGKRDHEQDTPVWVKASSSTPILKLRYPPNVGRGDRVRLDASESFTTQGSDLEMEWRQVSGVPVVLEGQGSIVEFKVPDADPYYEFWVALAQSLVRHPEFLFTRSSAMDWVSDERQRKQLQLSRLALDLVGRAPTSAELNRSLANWNWDRIVDEYLASDEFKKFYQHRIRLYLESQGTAEQDEPVLLWCYVAFNDLPFQQILTGDYTVDPEMQRQSRPSYHGKTGLLTSAGFIAGKPGLPHYNYAAQVSMLFLGYRYEVPADIVEQREGVTALGTTDPNSACYGCHKILTPLALQRNYWTDDGRFRLHDEYGLPIDASDQGLVDEYPFKGEGLEAFALQAVRKERFIRTMIDTHFDFFFGRSMRYRTDERALYRSLWESVHRDGFTIRGLVRALVTSELYDEVKQ